MSVAQIYNSTQARSSILRRVQWDDQEMPASVLDGIERIFGARIAPAEAVARILRDVRARGDAALHEWAQRIDRRPQGAFEVPVADWRAAYERLPEEQRAALDLAAERIAAFHRKQPMSSWVDTGPDGTLGQMIRPVDRASVYVPAAPRRCPRRC
jgi:histidinol dehydrogenase